MTPVATYLKDPDAVLDYSLSWADWLGSDTITASTWAVQGDAPALNVDSDSFDGPGRITTVWLSGGVAGTKYLVTNHVTTAGGRQDDRTIAVKVAER